jgi:asparagine synthase (glutamine-hydrolysing)
MCGIVGFINNNEALVEALRHINHRGPDVQRGYIYNNLAMGHTRLAILDLSENGNQPMSSDCGNYVIVFNGEIYNHLEIRKLCLRNRTFNSNSDTETLLYGFIEKGIEILNHLNGIFSFALFDKKNNKLLIVRDQFGVKPLYYYRDESFFWFSSEIKTLLHTKFQKEICYEALVNYLTFLYSPGEKTPFVRVEKLLPGHYLELDMNNFKDAIPIRYYDIPINPLKSTKSESELIEELDLILTKAVERQMLSDVPIGFFLSGGLDSSALVAIARKLYPDRLFSCYTIKTNEGEDLEDGFVNDLRYARKVAKYLNVNLIEVESNVDLVEEFDKMIFHLDEPQSDSAPFSVLQICRQAREDGNIVLIGGTAGDDVFSGYRRHQALNFEKYIEVTPYFLRKLIRKIIFFLPPIKSFNRRLRRLVNNIHRSKEDRLSGYFSWLEKSYVQDLFVDHIKFSLIDYDVMNYHNKMLKVVENDKELLNKILYLEMKTFLVDHNLNYTDKMGMATGVEVRVPFLDKELVEFSTKIPTELKMKGLTTKYILKKVMEKYLPHDVIYRPKSGFGAPVRKWITELMDEKISAILSKDSINKRGIFNAEKVHKLIADNKVGDVDASYSIWCLLAIESWMQQFLDKEY